MAETQDMAGDKAAKRIANLFSSCLPSEDDTDQAKKALNLPSVEHLVELAKMLDEKKISSTNGKDVFAEMLKSDDSPIVIAKKKKLLQVSDSSAIEKMVDEVITWPTSQVMKRSHGQANPGMAGEMLRQKLSTK